VLIETLMHLGATVRWCISASRVSGPSTAPEYLAEFNASRRWCEF
jgi:hypothetical protein